MPCCFHNHDVALTGSHSTDREVLPASVKPVHYHVDITPNFDSFKFTGTVKVELKVLQETTEIICNANELEVHSGKVIKGEESFEAMEIIVDAKKETVKYVFDQSFNEGSDIVLESTFTGIHNDKMAGFYRSGYNDKDGNKKWMVVTQFEATDCRRAFPSWDEPALKATFDVTLRVDPELTALSNMNQVSEETVDVEGKPLKVCKFATTPIMSTYLVAFAVGDLEYIETTAHPKKPDDAKPITVRVYTSKGDSEQGRFALDVGARTLEFFSEYFDTPYPLPKMDMIAIPDFGAGAMENWGLVTYRTIYLLFNEETSSAKSKQSVAYVVGHELAHQWFGNLVTMEWWSDLWLNEGFATFVGWLAVDHLFPDWDIWTQFVIGDLSSGLSLDALRSSHPIQVDVKSPTEITQIFDAISYSKGASVIRMLNAFLGQETFMNGVRAYLKKFKYQNAKTEDLWTYLSSESGKDVATLMHTWTRCMGYPMVTVASESFDPESKQMTIKVHQKRFLSSGDLSEEEDQNSPLWWIPLGIVTNLQSDKPLDFVLKDKEDEFTFPYDASSSDAYYKLNFRTTGFFRVSVPAETLATLSKQIADHPHKFSTPDRVGLVTDSFALAASGLGSTVASLEVLKNFAGEENYVVLNEMASQLNKVLSIWYLQPKSVIDQLNQLKRDIFSPKVSELGFDYPSGEDHLKALKRTLVVSCAAKAGDPKVIDELVSRFEKSISGNDSALHPNLRGVAYCVSLKNAQDPEKVFESIFNIYKTAKTTDQKLTALASLGAVGEEKLVHRFLNEIALDETIVRPQDIIYPLVGLTHESPMPAVVRPSLWCWCVENWDLFVERYKPSLALLGRILSSCTESTVSLEFVETVTKWSKGDELSDDEAKAKRKEGIDLVRNKLDQALEHIKINSRWVVRVSKDVEVWLTTQYATSPAGEAKKEEEGSLEFETAKEKVELKEEEVPIPEQPTEQVEENEKLEETAPETSLEKGQAELKKEEVKVEEEVVPSDIPAETVSEFPVANEEKKVLDSAPESKEETAVAPVPVTESNVEEKKETTSPVVTTSEEKNQNVPATPEKKEEVKVNAQAAANTVPPPTSSSSATALPSQENKATSPGKEKKSKKSKEKGDKNCLVM